MEFNLPLFTVEFWLKPDALITNDDGAVVLCSSALPDDLTTPSNGYLVVVDPCGTLSVLLGTGRSTAGASALTPLTACLTKTCTSFQDDIASPDFPWMIVRGPVDQSRWQHVAIEYSDTLSRLSLFINAELVSSRVYADRKYNPNYSGSLTLGASAEPELRLLGVRGGSCVALPRVVAYSVAAPSSPWLRLEVRIALFAQLLLCSCVIKCGNRRYGWGGG